MAEDHLAAAALLAAWHHERHRIVATISRRLGDVQLAEDAVQEAYAVAAVRWATHGVPDRPGAWLTTTAWHQALDVIRRNRLDIVPLTDEAYDRPEVDDDDLYGDSLLGMLLACCHPSLELAARVALTLRHVGGLTASEIASAFLVSESTMEKRLVRARKKIREAGISFAVPAPDELDDRVAGVRAVIYLIFTEGHHATGATESIRSTLCDEAVWLAEQLWSLDRDAETAGLLALLLLLNSRTPARTDSSGALTVLDDQDPSRWNSEAITRAKGLLGDAASQGDVGRYQIEAAIALHHTAPLDGRETDWMTVAGLYGMLVRVNPSPTVVVNHAVALDRAGDGHRARQLLVPLLSDPALEGYAELHVAHATLLDHAGEAELARRSWERAIALTVNPAQRDALRRRIEHV